MLTPTVRLERHPLATWSGPEIVVTGGCAVRADGAAECRFEVTGDIDRILVPGRTAARRCDGLWRHTCLEAFVARREERDYLEFNFAPSGNWAAYAFSDYRTPAPAPEIPAPSIRVEQDHRLLTLVARLAPASWPADAPLEIGLAAVIETKHGALGYFALRHPAAAPDFHDRWGFALSLGRQAEAS